MKFVLLINVKMTTFVGILTFMITGLDDLTQKIPFILAINIYVKFKFHVHAQMNMKFKVLQPRAWSVTEPLLSRAILPDSVYHYLVSILSTQTDNLLFFNKQHSLKDSTKECPGCEGQSQQPLGYKAHMLLTELLCSTNREKKIVS